VRRFGERDWIEAVTAERPASRQPPYAKPSTSHDTMGNHRIAHVVGTRGLEPTGAGKQR
jgi:hypothetical protein